jgi:hypothetical protein
MLSSERIDCRFRRGAENDQVLDLVEMAYRGDDIGEIVLRPVMDESEVRAVIASSRQADVLKPQKGTTQSSMNWQVTQSRCFLDLGVSVSTSVGHRFESIALSYGVQLYGQAQDRIMAIIHIPGLRGLPGRAYPATGTGPRFPGPFDPYTASVVHDWQEKGDDRASVVGTHLESLGLTWTVKTRRILSTQIEVLVGRLPHRGRNGADDLVNIADVGFGVSQVLPVLVALLAAEPGRLVYLEQPELHLHPRAQVALAGILADAAKRGVRVVAETHSALLLLAVQTLVAEGSLPPGDVILHWFERGKDGVTKVKPADLDEAGRFGDWPEDFGSVTLRAQGQYLDAAESVLEGDADA